MIVLDTNQLEYAQPPDGPLLAMLQTIASPAGHELCLPEMALEEHLAHYRSKMDDAVREYAAASQELRRLIRYLTLPPIPMVNVGNAVKDREQRLLEVLPYGHSRWAAAGGGRGPPRSGRAHAGGVSRVPCQCSPVGPVPPLQSSWPMIATVACRRRGRSAAGVQRSGTLASSSPTGVLMSTSVTRSR